jgi:hypothetical protein
MFSGTMVARHLVLLLLCSTLVLAQQKPAAPGTSSALEFPVVMQQVVNAGATVVGTKVAAKLVVATLVNGTVVPRAAIFSGEVTESVKRSATDPSRLAIRMDSVQWRTGSAPIEVYLTAWYYPNRVEMGQSLQYAPPDAANSKKNWNGAGAYPDPNSPINQPFPGRDSDKDSKTVPDTPTLITSNHRVPMKNVDSEQNREGALSLTCKRSNIKLDRLTT